MSALQQKDAVELRFPPDVAFVGIARLLVTLAARGAGMAPERSEDLRIAVSEATTNAVRAHQAAGTGAPVIIAFGPGEHGFEVVVQDAGPGFDPVDPVEMEESDWRKEGGLGVTIIRGLADVVQFERAEGMQVNMRFSVGLEP